MGGSRSHSEFFSFRKSSQNIPKPVLIFWSSIPGVFCLYIYISCTLLKVVGYYDLSVLFMSVMGFKKSVAGWGELYPVLFWIFLIFLNFAKPLSAHHNE